MRALIRVTSTTYRSDHPEHFQEVNSHSLDSRVLSLKTYILCEILSLIEHALWHFHMPLPSRPLDCGSDF